MCGARAERGKKRGRPKTRVRMETVRRGATGMAGGLEGGRGEQQRARRGAGQRKAELGRFGGQSRDVG